MQIERKTSSGPNILKMSVRSGGAVLCIAAAQLMVGLCLLGIYEGYKSYYYTTFVDGEGRNNKSSADIEEATRTSGYESPLDFRSPMGFSYYLAIVNNCFAVFGLAGVLNSQREMVMLFFGYNTAQMVVTFHYFVDLCSDAGISYNGEPTKLSGYEQAAAAFIFLDFLLSASATYFSVRAVDEIKAKQRDEYNRFTVLSDTLQYENDTS